MEDILSGIDQQEEWKKNVIYFILDISRSCGTFIMFTVACNAALLRESSDLRKAINQSCKHSENRVMDINHKVNWVQNFISRDCKLLYQNESHQSISNAPFLATVVGPTDTVNSISESGTIEKHQARCRVCSMVLSKKSLLRHLRIHNTETNQREINVVNNIRVSKQTEAASTKRDESDDDSDVSSQSAPLSNTRKRRLAKTGAKMYEEMTISDYDRTSSLDSHLRMTFSADDMFYESVNELILEPNSQKLPATNGKM